MQRESSSREWNTRFSVLVGVVLIHFVLRIHGNLTLPVFLDETRHILRAQAVYRFDTNPMTISHGKLLLYYWLGLFSPDLTLHGLFVARAAVTLLSLVTIVSAAAIARELFGRRAMLPTAVFYALVPHALFFERVAIADPVAAAVATLAVLISIRMVKRPQPQIGALVGLLVILAILVKLTLVGLLIVPVAAILLLDETRSPGGKRGLGRSRIAHLLARYGPALKAMALVIGVPVVVVGGAAGIALLRDQSPTVMDASPCFNRDFVDRTDQLVEIVRLMVSLPGALLLFVAALILLRTQPRPILFVWAWLAVVWLPIIVLCATQRARYLMVGMPAVACLAGAVSVQMVDVLRTRFSPAVQRSVLDRTLPVVGVAVALIFVAGWVIGFALPFAHAAVHEPDHLDLPELDTHNYMQGRANAWGLREALAYLQLDGERSDAGAVPVYGVLWICDLANAYLTPDLDWQCADYRQPGAEYAPDALYYQVGVVLDTVAPSSSFLYVVNDDKPSAWDGPHGAQHWRLERCFAEPGKIRPVCIWRVTKYAPPEVPRWLSHRCDPLYNPT